MIDTAIQIEEVKGGGMSNWVMAGVAIVGVIIAYYAWRGGSEASGATAAVPSTVTGDSGIPPVVSNVPSTVVAPVNTNASNTPWSTEDYIYVPEPAAWKPSFIPTAARIETYVGGSGVAGGTHKKRNPYVLVSNNASTTSVQSADFLQGVKARYYTTVPMKTSVGTVQVITPTQQLTMGGGGGGVSRHQ